MSYTPTIGLEVHAELATASKMFCGCKNQPHGVEPNTHVCPVCMAHPGTLPVPNEEAIAMVLRFGQAIGANKATYSEFDRKNYFYPDIPKAYQISQYKFPFLSGGEVEGVELTRVHLEEDTARSSHELADSSLVDFNRAGVPLMELVTEPVLHTAKDAGDFARELQLLLQTLGISDANMERGEMRIEANVSISTTDEFGTKVEVKNINSFKAVEAAIAYEIARQQEVLEAGEEVTQETRGWDENKSVTFSQRTKETAKDYRYFPDPDIPKIQVDTVEAFTAEVLSEKIPILPNNKRISLKEYEISEEHIETIISDKQLDTLFFQTIGLHSGDGNTVPQAAANYLAVDVAGLRAADDEYDVSSIVPAVFLELLQLLQDGTLGSRGAKELLKDLPDIQTNLRAVAKERGLLQMSSSDALQPIVEAVVTANPDQVSDYKSGNEKILKYLVGQGMKESKGAANPQVLEDLLRSMLVE